MKFGIYSNLTRDIDGKAVIAVAKLLADKKIEFALSEDLVCTKIACEYLSNDALAKACDVIILFGGDGTVLHYAKLCSLYNTSIFAVNVGRVGFLTESENIDLNDSIDKIIAKDYILEKRTLLKAKVCGQSYLALNDCVISRGSKVALIDLEYKINNCITGRMRSDALIVATPTGSTAYSLSCGGAIVAPSVNCILITPVSSYSLSSRPLIVSDDSIIEIDIMKAYSVYLNIDGENVLELTENDKIIIGKADIIINFIRLDRSSFFKKLQQKFKIME